MNKCILYFVLTSLIFALHACYEEPICHNSTRLRNNSTERIFVQTKKMKDNSDTLLGSTPDFVLELGYEITNWDVCLILPGHTKWIIPTSCYEYSMNDNSRNYYSVMILDWPTISGNPWDTIRKHDMILKRYVVNLEYLEKNSYTLTFP